MATKITSIIINSALLLSILTTTAFAASKFKNMKFRNMMVNYADGNGQASSESIELNFGFVKIDMDAGNFQIQKTEKDFRITQNDMKIIFKGLRDSYLGKIEQMSATNVSLDLVLGNSMVGSLDNAQLDGDIDLHQLTINCKSTTRINSQNTIAALILPCISSSTITANFLDFKKSKGSIPTDKGILKLDEFKNIKLYMGDGFFKLKAETKYIFKIKIKIDGRASYEKTSKLFTLQIGRAKASKFSIKKRLLKQIKDAHISNVTVVGDLIKIQL